MPNYRTIHLQRRQLFLEVTSGWAWKRLMGVETPHEYIGGSCTVVAYGRLRWLITTRSAPAIPVALPRWVAAWCRVGRVGPVASKTSFVRSLFLRFGGPERCSVWRRMIGVAHELSASSFVHLLDLCLMAARLIGAWYADVRSRQARDLRLFAEAIRTVLGRAVHLRVHRRHFSICRSSF